MTPERFSTDPYMAREWVDGEYVCFDFLRDVWLDLKGVDLGDRLRALALAPGERRPLREDLRAGFERLDRPEDPCAAFFRHPRQNHVGAFIRGRVLHLTRRSGVLFEPLKVVAIGFRKVTFYR